MNYELSEHAHDVLADRQISTEWLERALFSPQLVERHEIDTECEYRFARIPEHGDRVLRVVVNKQAGPVRVVTAYFDRAMKGKL